MVKKVFWPWIFLQMLCPFKARKLGAFLAHGRQYRRMGLVYFVTSYQCFIRARNKDKQREIASFFTECLILVLFLDVTTKVNSENGRALHRIPFFNDHPRSEGEEGKKWIDFAISHCLWLFRGRMCFDSLFLAICISPLGLESGEIKDEALSHSLPSSHLSKPSFIRLHGLVSQYPFGWQARIAQTPPDYLQVTRPTIYFVIWHKCLC